jgi:hypothetical protein
MKSMSIHGVDKEMAERIREKADEYGISVNRTMKKLLGDSLGLSQTKNARSTEFDDLCGALPKEAADELRRVLEEMDTIDREAWS